MQALLIQLNGRRHCLAGLPNGGISALVGWSGEQSAGPYHIAVYGCDLATNEVALWPAADLQVGDEVTISVVEVDCSDPPECSGVSPATNC